jgi:dTDP-4-amino-4,6-dideoxygalactose transaminase
MTSAEPAFESPLHVGRPNILDREEFLRLVEGALDRVWLSNHGPLVQELEARLAEYLGVRHCVTTVNGTVGLEIAIRALGLTGEVIVPSFTFVATVHALHRQGLTPVFADIDPRTHCIDPASVRRLITPATSGILGVHLWGRAADVDELQTIADEHGLALLFDAAHSFGVSVGPRMVGAFGRAEVMSFHATKFFNTVEGGAIITNDDDLARTARLMRNFGFTGEDAVAGEGTNGKLSEISAAMGLANLGHLDEVIAANRRNHDAYERELAGIPGISLLPADVTGRGNYQYVVMMVDADAGADRDAVLARLRENNVLARRYFWPGAHRMEPYRTLFPDAGENLPVTAQVAEQVVVLPTGTAVDPADIAVIARLIREAVIAPS